ncbi:MAG: radical SAM protein [candidate division WOR-3 bacterium]
MKILGLNPKDFYSGWPVQSDFGRELYRSPALTFPVLSRLLPPGHELRFFEGFFEPVPMSRYRELIRWPDVVRMNIASSYGAISYAVAIQQIKRLNPRAVIIAGGHHAAMFSRRWLDLGVDVIVKGEAELTFASLIEEIAGHRHFDRVPGLVFKADGEVRETPDPPQLETLDESPVPDLSLINFELYPCLIDKRGGHIGSLETSRGCSFRCKFCAVPVYWKGTQRYKSIPRVLKELDQLLAYRVHQINILDDGFGNDADYTEELARAFRQYKEPLNFNAFLRVDTVLRKPELIDLLAQAGMRATLLGFESLNEEVLRKCMGKGMRTPPDLKQIQEIYQRFRRNKILVVGVFISGHPEIAPEQETSYFSARTVCDDPRLADYMPFPGTFGFEELTKKYQVKDMFFHDVKLPVFAGQKINSFLFNFLNIIDLPRSLRLLTASVWHRKYLLWSHRQLWLKFFNINPRKLREFFLMSRKDLTSDQKQEQLLKWYLEDPEYQNWLDNITDKTWF